MTARAKIEAAKAEQWPRKLVSAVTVELPLPISTNDLWGPRMVKTARYRSWCRVAENMIGAQKLGTVAGPFSLTILCNPRRCKADLGNIEKAISDALQHANIIENDRLAERILIEWAPSVEGSRAIVERWQGQARAA